MNWATDLTLACASVRVHHPPNFQKLNPCPDMTQVVPLHPWLQVRYPIPITSCKTFFVQSPSIHVCMCVSVSLCVSLCVCTRVAQNLMLIFSKTRAFWVTWPGDQGTPLPLPVISRPGPTMLSCQSLKFSANQAKSARFL